MIARSYWRLKSGSAVRDWIGVVRMVMESIDRLFVINYSVVLRTNYAVVAELHAALTEKVRP